MWIVFNEDISEIFGTEYRFLMPLNKINILIGRNNSGKSYFMRSILNKTAYVISTENIKKLLIENLNKIVDYNGIKNFLNISILRDTKTNFFEIIAQINAFDAAKIATECSVIISQNPKINYDAYSFENFNKLKEESNELNSYIKFDTSSTEDDYSKKLIINASGLETAIIRDFKLEVINLIENMSEDDIIKNDIAITNIIDEPAKDSEILKIFRNPERKYIPIMRSIRNPSVQAGSRITGNDLFADRIKSEYNLDSAIDIITGLNIYSDFKKRKLGSKESRKNVDDFEKFLSNYFFEGKPVSIIPSENRFEIMVNIDDEEDFPIYEVGDGISSLIILLYDAFLNRNKTGYNVYFIEEPELNFHPGFQRLFMQTIATYDNFKNCYFFFTTHSNHIIDISSEITNNFSVYLCKKENNKINISTFDSKKISILKELGVQPSSVQIANKIIWVEGKYDALYIRLLLNVKNKNSNTRKYIEGLDYVFVPYGGANGKLINFTDETKSEENKTFILEANSINENKLIIMDDDGISASKAGNKKIEYYQSLKGKLNDSLYKLEVREIENLFPEEVVRKYFLNGINKNYKDLAINALDKIQYDKYKDKKLGWYLNRIVKEYIGENLKEITGRIQGFENNGFLYSKSLFSEIVIDWINNESFDYEKMLPVGAKNLVDKVENFIRQ